MTKRAIIFDVTDSRSRVVEMSLAPVEKHRRRIARGSGIDLQVVVAPNSQRLADVVRDHSPDIALILTDWSHSSGYVEYCMQATRDGLAGRGSVAIFDTYDPSNSPHLSSLPLVDRYLKKVMFKDPGMYTKGFEGGYVVTDYLGRELGYDLGNHELGSIADADELHKMRLSWSFGAAPKFSQLLRIGALVSKPFAKRAIDVSCRLGVRRDDLLLTGDALSKMNWYPRHRLEALRAIRAAGESVRCSSSDRCSRRTYLLEMFRTRIVVSPFGYGELCYRDYEAVCCGALLMKPDVGHMMTRPNIFVAGETYIPLRWDFADLPEKIQYYLKHEDEAAAIAARAQDVMRRYFSEHRIVQDVKEALDGL